MREFFHGWRRKAGCVTLVIAISLTCLLIRGFSIADRVWFGLGENQHMVCSVDGRIWWFSWRNGREYHFSQFASTSVADEISRQRFWMGFHGVFRNAAYSILPLWYLVLPLTLLSTFLILWRPRKTPAKPVVDGDG